MTKDARTKATIRLAQHPEFPSTIDCAAMTTSSISRHVNSLFRRVFADYEGCKVIVDQQQDPNGISVLNQIHPIQVELYFPLGNVTDGDNSKVYAFRPITDKINNQKSNLSNNMGYTSRCLGHNIAMTTNKSSEITQDAIDIFHPLLWREVQMRTSVNPSPAEFANLGIYVEGSTSNNSGIYTSQVNSRIIYNIVKFVDINSILSILFGEKDEDTGSRLIYQVTPIKPFDANMNTNMITQRDRKWVFYVYRNNEQSLADMVNELGGYNVTNSLNICTD